MRLALLSSRKSELILCHALHRSSNRLPHPCHFRNQRADLRGVTRLGPSTFSHCLQLALLVLRRARKQQPPGKSVYGSVQIS